MINTANRRQWLIILSLALGPAVSNGLARFAYGLILPAMREDLAWNYTQAGWINTANAIGYLVGAVLTLGLIKRIGAPRLFLIGMVLMSIALLASGFTRDLGLLTVWRIFAGIGGAPAFIAAGAIAAGVFVGDTQRSALAIAITLAGGGGVGMLASGLMIPAVLAHLSPTGWPQAWMLLGGLAALSSLPAPWALRQLRLMADAGKSAHAQIDPDRAGIATDRSGITPGPANTASFSANDATAPAAGTAALAALLAYFLFGAGFIGYITFLVAWLKANDAGPAMITASWALMSLMVMASPFVWQDVLASGRAAGVAAAACAVAALAVPLLLFVPGAAGMMISTAVFGGSFFIVPTAITAFTRRNFPQSQWGSVVALFTVAMALGQIVGPVATGALADRAGGVSVGLAIAGCVLLLGALAAWLQKPLAR